ncbi:YukJ family protein [Granulicella sp. L60]|uniref:YukJ family protein n=1 Tax=Granulicella sp. L60 TaxID=1641866 RepID=UPI00131E3E9E|nr:YukJ family protein [Granulicella sp. L60]
MPISNYSVLAGDPTAGKVVTGSSAHYQITMQAPGGPFTVAVNIQSVDGSEVLYDIAENFTPPDLQGLLALPMGMTALKSEPGGLALDFVRSTVNGQPMITKAQMMLLPKPNVSKSGSEEERMMQRAHSKALENAVVTLLNMTIADKDGVIYAFGSAYSDSGKVDGIHDIHMNQGNPKNNHGGDNGVWQDGALLIHLPSQGTWTAVFIAFQTESWNTDASGNPASGTS